MGVAFAAPPAFGHQQTLSGLQEFAQQFSGFVIINEGAQGHVDDEGRGVPAVAVLALAPAAFVRLENFAPFKVNQGASAGRGFQNDIAAFAAVTAVGPALGPVPRPQETDATGSTGAAPDGDLRLIGKGFQAGG